MKQGANHPVLADLIGLDVYLSFIEGFYSDSNDPRASIKMLLRNPISELRCSPYLTYGCASRSKLGPLATHFDRRSKVSGSAAVEGNGECRLSRSEMKKVFCSY